MRKYIFVLFLSIAFIFVFIPHVFAATLTKNPTVDTFINAKFTDASYGDAATLLLEYIPDTPVNTKILTKFDISQIPKCSKINFAKIELWENGGMGTAVPAMLDGARITSNWDGNVTWNSQPTIDAPSTGIQDRHSIQYKQWQVTDHVQKWLDGKYPNYGFEIYYAGDQDKSVIRSYESNSDGNQHKPLLTVDYTPPAAGTLCTQNLNLDIKISPFVPRITITLAPSALLVSNVVGIPTSDSAVITWKTNKKSSSWVWYGNVFQGQDNVASHYGQNDSVTDHQVTLTYLASNTKYSYKVYSKDSDGKEIYSSINYFTTPKVESNTPTAIPTNTSSLQSNDEVELNSIIAVTGTPTSVISPTSVIAPTVSPQDQNMVSLFNSAFINKNSFGVGILLLIGGGICSLGALILYLKLKTIHNHKKEESHLEKNHENRKDN